MSFCYTFIGLQSPLCTIGELELLIKKTYENSVLGNLSSERMASLLAGYEEEQAELKAEASRIESEINEYHKSKDNAIDFVNLIEKYIGIKELTYELLHELIDRIEVGEKYEYQGETYQDKLLSACQNIPDTVRFFGNFSFSHPFRACESGVLFSLSYR